MLHKSCVNAGNALHLRIFYDKIQRSQKNTRNDTCEGA